ncbi:MAG: prenyltransferase/squalene oxidase repeat-containing protein [Candidatus Helarchaeota archaeon]
MRYRIQLFSIIAVIVFMGLIPSAVMTTTTRGDLLISFTDRCYNTEGGFTEYPNNNPPDIQSTYQSLYILSTYGLLFRYDKITIARWINETQNSDGGFPYIENESSSMEATFYAVMTLKLLGYMPHNNVTNWINQCWNDNFGFGNIPNSTSTILSSYYALSILSFLGINLSQYNTSQWLLTLQNNQSELNYGAFSSDGINYNLLTTYFALEALNLTGNLNDINKTAAIEWISACQNIDPYKSQTYGSFSSDSSSLDYSIMNCYAALKSLTLLNSSINLSQYIIDWILNCQNLIDGGFATSITVQSSSVASSFYAIISLNILNAPNLFSLSITSTIPFNFPVWALIILIPIAGIVIIYAIKKKYY